MSAGLAGAGITPGVRQTREQALDGLPFLVIIWTFDFVTALGAVLAVLAGIALLLAAEARRRQNVLSGVLLGRMGLRMRTLTASHLLELGSAAVAALAVGAGSGLVATAVAVGWLDPAPRLAGTVQIADQTTFLVSAVAVTAGIALLATAAALRGVHPLAARDLLRAHWLNG